MDEQWRLRNQVAGGGWNLGMLSAGLLVGALAGFGVRDLFPEESDGPLFVGFAVALGLFAVLAAIGVIGDRLLIAIAELNRGSQASGSPD